MAGLLVALRPALVKAAADLMKQLGNVQNLLAGKAQLDVCRDSITVVA